LFNEIICKFKEAQQELKTLEPSQIQGGAKDYYEKYMKYKEKYLSLKAQMF
jgi:hypothetical protein